MLSRLSQRVHRAEAETVETKPQKPGASTPKHPELAPPPPPRIKPARSRRPGRGDD